MLAKNKSSNQVVTLSFFDTYQVYEKMQAEDLSQQASFLFLFIQTAIRISKQRSVILFEAGLTIAKIIEKTKAIDI